MSSLKIIIVIFARSDSVRLKNKHLKKIGNSSVLKHLFDRSALINNISDIYLATTLRNVDDNLVKCANKIGYKIFRGEYRDVLGRLYNLAEIYQPDYVLKVNGDCPFISYELSNLMIDKVINNKSISFITAKGKLIGCPVGLGPELLSKKTIDELQKKTPKKFRESITGFIFEKNNSLKINYEKLKLNKNNIFSGPNFTLDTDNDLKFLNKFWIESGSQNSLDMNLKNIKKTIKKIEGANK